MRKCRTTGEACLIYADLNSHCHLWGSPDDNARGLIFEDELIREFGLEVLNEGNSPTYYGGNTINGTHIDVSMCTSNLTRYCRNWNNRDSVVSSDHTLLEHTLLLGQPLEDEYKYGYKRASEKDMKSYRYVCEDLFFKNYFNLD